MSVNREKAQEALTRATSAYYSRDRSDFALSAILGCLEAMLESEPGELLGWPDPDLGDAPNKKRAVEQLTVAGRALHEGDTLCGAWALHDCMRAILKPGHYTRRINKAPSSTGKDTGPSLQESGSYSRRGHDDELTKLREIERAAQSLCEAVSEHQPRPALEPWLFTRITKLMEAVIGRATDRIANDLLDSVHYGDSVPYFEKLRARLDALEQAVATHDRELTIHCDVMAKNKLAPDSTPSSDAVASREGAKDRTSAERASAAPPVAGSETGIPMESMAMGSMAEICGCGHVRGQHLGRVRCAAVGCDCLMFVSASYSSWPDRPIEPLGGGQICEDFTAPETGEVKVFTSEPWRVGRKVKRTIYAGEGRLVGLMDTPELAKLVVDAVNARLARRDVPDPLAAFEDLMRLWSDPVSKSAIGDALKRARAALAKNGGA